MSLFSTGQGCSTEGAIGDFAADPFVAMSATLECGIGIDVDGFPIFEDGIFEDAIRDTESEGKLFDFVDHVAFAVERQVERIELDLLFDFRARIAFDDAGFDADFGVVARSAIHQGLFGRNRIYRKFPLGDNGIGTGSEFDTAFKAFADHDAFGRIDTVELDTAENYGDNSSEADTHDISPHVSHNLFPPLTIIDRGR